MRNERERGLEKRNPAWASRGFFIISFSSILCEMSQQRWWWKEWSSASMNREERAERYRHKNQKRERRPCRCLKCTNVTFVTSNFKYKYGVWDEWRIYKTAGINLATFNVKHLWGRWTSAASCLRKSGSRQGSLENYTFPQKIHLSVTSTVEKRSSYRCTKKEKLIWWRHWIILCRKRTAKFSHLETYFMTRWKSSFLQHLTSATLTEEEIFFFATLKRLFLHSAVGVVAEVRKWKTSFKFFAILQERI